LACDVITSLLCAHFLPANRACENRKSDFITRFGQDLANEARQQPRSQGLSFWHDKWVKWQNSLVPGFQKQLQTAIILSVTFILSYP
jgi:hypothetical protein